MGRWVVPVLLLSSLLGCARGARPGEAAQTPRYEHVFHKPVEEALAATRELLAERGYAFEATRDDTLLLTRWLQPPTGTQGNGIFERYVVVGLRVAPRQSVVRIFRARRVVTGNDVQVRDLKDKISRGADEAAQHPFARKSPFDAPMHQTADLAEQRGLMHGKRDLELEKELTRRLESGASIEVLAGNMREEPAARTVVRDSSFYLTRWRDDVAGSASEPCSRPVKGLAELLRPGRIVLVGEQLGTHEAPAVVGDMVCEVADQGYSVTLAVTLPHVEQARLEAYLASPGAPADQDELLRGDFWRKPVQDGRGSRAMMELVDRVRSLRAIGMPISLLAIGIETSRGNPREMAMADLLLEQRQRQREDVLVVLAGNAHVRTQRGAPWDENFIPMAWHLSHADASLVSFDLGYAQGSRWGCELDRGGQLRCGVVGATPADRVAMPAGLAPHVKLFSKPTEEGFHGLLYVGALSPSVPATALSGPEAPVPSSMPEHLIQQTQQPARPNAPPIF
ncbi:hypothetical protein P2318_21685 [Myxococcaceae bacterium GXIMD 01537]